MTTENEMQVFTAISKVMATLAKAGISKDRRNEQQNYKFRGIDDVYNALSSALVDAGLVIIPRFANRHVVERITAKGSVLFYTSMEGHFRIFHVGGSCVEVGPFYGEAMDSGDKSSNKAMSAAYKYMAMEVFCIPTEGDNDADGTTHDEIAAVDRVLTAAAEAEARKGTLAFRTYYKTLSKDDRHKLEGRMDGLKALAQTADIAGFTAEMDREDASA